MGVLILQLQSYKLKVPLNRLTWALLFCKSLEIRILRVYFLNTAITDMTDI